jgi:hypothetical protein
MATSCLPLFLAPLHLCPFSPAFYLILLSTSYVVAIYWGVSCSQGPFVPILLGCVLFTGPICAHFTGVCLVYRAHLCTFHWGMSCLQGPFVHISLGCVLFTGPIYAHFTGVCVVHRVRLCTLPVSLPHCCQSL